MDWERIAAELVRALRGSRSQQALSKRLGARSNVVHTWEAGRRWPTAARTLWVAQRTGIDVGAAIERFYRRRPAWLDEVNPVSAPGVACLLEDLRGGASIGELARRTGRSRFAVSRWLKGDAEPRLPDFLRMLEATSLRLLDFVAALVDPARLPSLARPWQQLELARRAAYDMPWSHVLLRALELDSYRALPKHDEAWVAAAVSMPRQEVTRALQMLTTTGQVTFDGRHYRPGAVGAVDTGRDPERDRGLKAFFSQLGTERAAKIGPGGLFSYNLFTVSHADLQRLEQLHRSYFRELRGIVAASQPADRVVVTNMQLFALGDD